MKSVVAVVFFLWRRVGEVWLINSYSNQHNNTLAKTFTRVTKCRPFSSRMSYIQSIRVKVDVTFEFKKKALDCTISIKGTEKHFPAVLFFFSFFFMVFYSEMKSFISCPIWTDLEVSHPYRPYELELFLLHTQCQHSHRRGELVCQIFFAPGGTFCAFLRCSKCYIQNTVTYLAKQENC